jgi:amino acid adenylation domain-containing protein
MGSIEYNTDLFNRDRIERMATNYRTLLEAVIADPNQPIATLAILTEAERQQILVEWNETAADYPKDKCIHELFETQTERTPEAVAVQFEGEQLTYRELNSRANQVAHFLRGVGVGPEKLVGICVERSLDMVVGLLAILKAGGAYVPLDPAYPKERLEFMLQDAQISVLLTQVRFIEDRGWNPVLSEAEGMDDRGSRFFRPGSGQHSVLNAQMKMVCLDTDWETLAGESEQNPHSEVRPDHLAYVIYTSGSSGEPKGVKINHNSVVNLCYLTNTKLGFDETDVWTLFHSYAFDFSVWEIWGCLLSGGRLLVVPLQLTRSPDGFLKLLRGEGVTVLNQTPTAISQLAERISAESDITDLSLRLIICGGEILSPVLATSLLAWGIPLWNFYGPTEATVWSAVHEVTSVDAQKSVIPIGRPLANTQIYVLDTELQPVPIGVQGEIYIGGDGLAREYLNRPELTAERFIQNNLKFGTRIYRTGDLGSYRSDGSIECHGRADNQVKVRGYRVELGEIEAHLRQHPAIEDAVVVLSNGPLEKSARARSLEPTIAQSFRVQRLIGYIVFAEQNLSLAELRAFLRKKLPEYMVPSTFLFLDSLPVSANGKIDRQALPLAKDLRSGLEYLRAEPRTRIEEMLAEIWKEVLKLDSININDNFFELGGHSLLAVQIISRVRETCAKDVSIHAMFEMPTIAELAFSLEKTDNRNSSYLPPITRVPRDIRMPLSMNQEHSWYLDQVIPGTPFFNMPYVYQLSGDLNISSLEKALREVIRRHEALRTVFAHENGRPVQIIKEATDFRLPVIDLRNTRSDVASDMAVDTMLEERTCSFDLAVGPLVRTKLLCLTNSDHLLLVTMHHIISDEWSMRVLYKELTTFYDAYSRGVELPPSVCPVQHADFTHWERELLNRRLLEGQLHYWTKQLAGPVTELKFKKARRSTKPKSFGTRRILFEFAEDLFPAIRQVAKAENATPFGIILAALNILVYQWTEQRDIRVGTLVANRGRKESEYVIGHFMNTIVLRNKVVPQLTFRQFVKQVGKGLRSALANQELPFHHLAQVLKRDRGISRATLVPVMFVYHKHSLDVVRLSGMTFAPVGWQYPDSGTGVMITPCDLMINMWEMKTKIVATVNYKPDVFSNKVVSEMVTQLTMILKQMVTDMEVRLHSCIDIRQHMNVQRG